MIHDLSTKIWHNILWYILYIYIYCGKDSPHEIDIYLLIFLWHDLKRFEESVGFSVWWPVSICFLQNRWLQQGLTRTTWLISPRCIMCIDSGPQIHPKGVASTISADLFILGLVQPSSCCPKKKTQPMKPQSWKANVTQVIVSGHWICPQASFALQYRLLRTKILEGQKDCGKPLHCIPSLGSLESENVLTHRFVQGFLCQWR